MISGSKHLLECVRCWEPNRPAPPGPTAII